MLPPLWFDLDADPAQLDYRSALGATWDRIGPAAAALMGWRMRNEERTLSYQLATPDEGLVVGGDLWR